MMNRLLLILVVTLTMLAGDTAWAKGGSRGGHRSSTSHSRSSGSGPVYGGGKHTESHGGTYGGGSGSSHKGGHYESPSGSQHYDTHK